MTPVDAYGGAHTWRARVRSAAGDVLGAGVLVGGDTVLTCAHVLAGDGQGPVPEVVVDLAGQPDAPATARVAEGCWVPQQDDGRGDVALLALDRPRPAAHSAPLYRLPPLPDRPVQMYGYPKHLDDGAILSATIAGPCGPRGEWVQLNPRTAAHTVRPGFSGAGVVDIATGWVIGMVVSRYDDPGTAQTPHPAPPEQRLRFSYMIPVETVVRHLPRVGRWVRGDRGVDPSFLSPAGTAGSAGIACPAGSAGITGSAGTAGRSVRAGRGGRDGPLDRAGPAGNPAPDPELARWLTRWLRRDGLPDVAAIVIGPAATGRSLALGRTVALADRELSAGPDGAAASGLDVDAVPPVGSLDLAIDVAGRTVQEVAKRVADRMDLLRSGPRGSPDGERPGTTGRPGAAGPARTVEAAGAAEAAGTAGTAGAPEQAGAPGAARTPEGSGAPGTGGERAAGPGSVEGAWDRVAEADSVPLTIVVEGVDRAADPDGLVGFLRQLAERGSRLLLVFRRPSSPALAVAEESLLFQGRTRLLGRRIGDLAGLERQLDQRAEVVTSARPNPRESSQLRIALTRLRAARSRGGRAAQRRLDALERAVAEGTDRIRAALEEADHAVARRDELRGLLDAQQARLAAHGSAEHPRTAPLYRTARELLWTTPCDVAAAGDAVHAFAGAVRDVVRDTDAAPEREARR